MLGFNKSKECPLAADLNKAREANKVAADGLQEALERVLRGATGTVAVFAAVEASDRRKIGRA